MLDTVFHFIRQAIIEVAGFIMGNFHRFVDFVVKYCTFRNISVFLVIWAIYRVTIFFMVTDFTTRAEADELIANACVTASKTFLQERAQITEFVGVTFQWDPFLDGPYRQVVLGLIESNEKFDFEKKYTCIFWDERPWFGLEHNVNTYAFNMDDQEFLAGDVNKEETAPHVKAAINAAENIVNPPTGEEDEQGWIYWITGF